MIYFSNTLIFLVGMFNLLQDDWKSALCFARTSEEIGHSWIALVASIKRKLHLCPKLRNSMPKVESLHFFLDIRIVSRSIYQIVDKMSQSVMKPAWNQYKGRVSSLLKLVNKDQPSESEPVLFFVRLSINNVSQSDSQCN